MTSKSRTWCCAGWRSVLIAVGTAVGSLTGAGCNLSEAGMSAHRSPDQFFAVLALEHHAINLSMVPPYDTVTLHTTREMGDGSVVPGEVVYSVSSPSLSVTNGVLKAESPVSRAVVRVTLTYGTITRTDLNEAGLRATDVSVNNCIRFMLWCTWLEWSGAGKTKLESHPPLPPGGRPCSLNLVHSLARSASKV